EALEKATKGPERQATRNITNFAEALRCMDNQFITYGVGGISILPEDILDSTKKVNAGTKDMLISAISRMTARSRAFRVIAYGSDSANTLSMLREKESKSQVENLPQFAIRGSISQLDESIGKKTEGVGFAFGGSGRAATDSAAQSTANSAGTGSAGSGGGGGGSGPKLAGLGLGRAAVASYNELGLDLNIIRVADLSVISGVNASNKVAILRTGVGTEGEAEYFKFGLNFQTNLSRSEGQSQALRNLVELAAIELLGKLTKVPYWKCLGADEKQENVKEEISEWFSSLFAAPDELIMYWQDQMRVRGLYTGEVNGNADDALIKAVMAYRGALGLEPASKLNEEFFTAYLAADHNVAGPKAKQVFAAMNAPKPVASAAPAVTPLNSTLKAGELGFRMQVVNGSNQAASSTAYAKGESIMVQMMAQNMAEVFCYLQDEKGTIKRFFPNRFNLSGRLNPKQAIQVPNTGDAFKLSTSSSGKDETIMCLATARQVGPEALPPNLRARDFADTKAQSLDEIRQAYERTQPGQVAHVTQTIKVK
ncbi:MAG: hypothetical protein RLZZ502_630, partial [Pseudomonadota bacterium]